MSEISLTASMRSNLLSLQNTSDLMNMTQERLSTGKKVNSAIDNPSSYYTAQSLTNRASDLSGLLDSMGQAISTIKAADEGITAITSFVEQAKAVASSALDTKDAGDRLDYMKQFDEIRDQIDELAKDSGYKGVNLINGDDLTVTFNEDRSSKLEIKGQTATTSGLGLAAADDWGGQIMNAATPPAAVTDGTAVTDKTAEIADGTLNSVYKVTEDGKTTFYAVTKAFTNTSFEDALAAGKMKELHAEYAADGTTVTGLYNADNGTAKIETAINAASDAINKLRTMASELGNNFSIVETRESFTESLVNVLEEGADKLTLADMNEESANMLALQTRQQLAINSLSLASQASQSVLKLF